MSQRSASELDELVAFECNEASFSVRSICGSEVTLEKVVCFPDEGGQRGCGLNGKKLPASGASVEIGTKAERSFERQFLEPKSTAMSWLTSRCAVG